MVSKPAGEFQVFRSGVRRGTPRRQNLFACCSMPVPAIGMIGTDNPFRESVAGVSAGLFWRIGRLTFISPKCPKLRFGGTVQIFAAGAGENGGEWGRQGHRERSAGGRLVKTGEFCKIYGSNQFQALLHNLCPACYAIDRGTAWMALKSPLLAVRQ